MAESFMDRFRKGLERTRDILNADVEDLVRGRRPLKPEDLDAIEEGLIATDLGLPATRQAMEVLRAKSAQIWTGGVEAMRGLLRDEIRSILTRPASVVPFAAKPWVVFVVGVNGVGKTTTIGKLAASWKKEGRTTLVCAADTFRAAAAEQLEIWARRTGAPFHRGAEGADPSSVLTDALRIARSKGYDAVLVDTAGRLHTQANLMEELTKVRRVIGQRLEGAPHETLLVIDATTGQNGLQQARLFSQAVEVTGIALTKLDGSAKGGIAIAIAHELGLPVKLIGIGESLDDLRPFDPDDFARALVGGD